MADSFQLKAIMSAVDKISPTLKVVRRGLGMTQKSFKDLGSASRGLLGGIGLAGVLSFAALGYGALNAAKGALEYAGALNDARDSTGMAVQPMQELQTMFEAGGVAGEEFLGSVTKLNKGLAEAGAGKNDGLAGLLTKLRVPLRNAKGEIRSVEEMLPELADAFAKNENPAVRTRMAMELFGKSGAKMIAVMQAGGAAMLAARQEAKRLGATLSDEATNRLDDLGDSFGLLNKQVKVQTAEAFGVAAPAIMSATKGLQEWIANNKDMLQQKIGGYITDIAQKFQAFVESGGIERLGSGIMAVVDGIGSFISAMGGIENVLMIVGALMLAGPAASAVQLAAVLLRMGTYVIPLVVAGFTALKGVTLSTLVAAGPIIALIAAIAAGAYLIYSNWSTIGPAVLSFLAPLMGALSGLRAAVSAYFQQMGTAISALLSVIGPLLMPVLSAVFTVFKAIAMVVGGVLYVGILALTKVVELLVRAFTTAFEIGAKVFEVGGKLLSGDVGGAIGSLFGSGDQSPVAAGGRILAAQQSNPAGAASSPLPAARGPLAAAGGLNGQAPAKVDGEMRVKFENAPPGMRVDPGKTNQSGFAMNPDVGYRSAMNN